MRSDRSWKVSYVLDTVLQVRHCTLDFRAPSKITVMMEMVVADVLVWRGMGELVLVSF